MGKKNKVIVDGEVFDSPLEADIYIMFRDNSKTKILDTHKTFILFDKLKYLDITDNKMKTQRKMQYTPDIIISIDIYDKPIAVEVKGYGKRKDYMMRKKLFRLLYDDSYHFVQINTIDECEIFLNELKETE